jgi:U3 small nucleolar RNA-associated protein MPP10
MWLYEKAGFDQPSLRFTKFSIISSCFQSERKRIRSSKKAARRKARKEKAADEKLIARVNPGLGLNNPYEKRKMCEELSVARAEGKLTTGKADLNTVYGSSGKFFKKMQDDVEETLQEGRESENLGQKKTARGRKSSSFML